MKKNPVLYIIMRLVFVIALLALFWYLIIPNSSLYYMDGTYKPFFNRLNERDLIMVPGDKFKLKVQRVNTRVKFSSLDIKVADVTPLGTIIAFRTGKTFITAKYNDKMLRCRVRVIKLNKKKIEINQGEKFDLDIEGPIILKKAKWTSSNSEIAEVNSFGKVRGISQGKTLITAKIGGKTLECKVVVSKWHTRGYFLYIGINSKYLY